jgi:hypothetical protein
MTGDRAGGAGERAAEAVGSGGGAVPEARGLTLADVLTGAGPIAAGLVDAGGVAGPRGVLVAQPTTPSKIRASIGIRFILFHHDPCVRNHVVCGIDERGVASRRTKTHEVAGR